MVIENKSYTIAETVLSYPIAYITRVLQMLMDGKETPPSFFERAASNPAGYLGKGFLNYKHKNNVPIAKQHSFVSFGEVVLSRVWERCNSTQYLNNKYNKLTNADIPCTLVCSDLVHQDPP
jgi:hypothetical protein